MRRTKLDKWIKDTEALPELSREGLEALQLKRLNETLERAAERGGAYEGYPRRLDSLEELKTLPFTTPEQLSRRSSGFLLTSQSQVERVISGATSGTTGAGKRVFYTREDMEDTVGFFAAGISEMLPAGERCLIAFPFTGPFGLGDLIARAVEKLGAEPVKAGYGQSWGELCALVRDRRPRAYIGFPVALLGLGRMYGPGFPIERALVSADACPEGLMKEIEKLTGSKPFPHYGSRECGLGGAVSCPAHEGMHLRENHIIAEIVDGAGNCLPPGEYGELVISTVGLRAMPLLRYRTGDYTRFLPPCPCGGVTRRIDRVSRRGEGPSMEKLDEALFRLLGLVDCRAEFDGVLKISARALEPGLEVEIERAVSACFPGLPVKPSCSLCSMEDGPMYPGKRHVLKGEKPGGKETG